MQWWIITGAAFIAVTVTYFCLKVTSRKGEVAQSSSQKSSEQEPIRLDLIEIARQEGLEPRKKRPQSRKRSAKSTFNKPARLFPTTKNHLWLQSVQLGEIIPATTIENSLGVGPVLGWPTSDNVVLAGFIYSDNLKFRKDGSRIKIGVDDYSIVEYASITGQALPIFTLADEGWQFRGFFRFNRPAGQSVACTQLLGPPPELVQLDPQSEEV